MYQQPSNAGVRMWSDAIGHLNAYRSNGGGFNIPLKVGMVRQIRTWQTVLNKTPQFLTRDERCENPASGTPSQGGNWSKLNHSFTNSNPPPQSSSITLTSSCQFLNTSQGNPSQLSTVDVSVLHTWEGSIGRGATFRVFYAWTNEPLPRGSSAGTPWFHIEGSLGVLPMT